jgi:hypothetical protein
MPSACQNRNRKTESQRDDGSSACSARSVFQSPRRSGAPSASGSLQRARIGSGKFAPYPPGGV